MIEAEQRSMPERAAYLILVVVIAIGGLAPAVVRLR
jgi:hypothetical protein